MFVDTTRGRSYICYMTLLGTVLENKYKIVGTLGEGGMGAVYAAVHEEIGRRVAVKMLHPRFSDNAQAVQRFYQEARIAGNLGHANICDVMDIGKTPGGLPFMVMPLLEGRSLGQELDECETLSASRALDIMCQVLSALSVAHEAGIVHRDLKPENIFLTHMGDRKDFVKILDFGISKVISAAAPGADNLTTTGMVMGTPYFMSPEQARGSKTVDQRTDIYAAGVLLYYLLTGVHPFEAGSYNELIVKIVTEPFRPPRARNPAIPVSVEQVIFKAMEKEPEKRFHTAAEFKEALLTRARDSGMGVPEDSAVFRIVSANAEPAAHREEGHESGVEEPVDESAEDAGDETPGKDDIVIRGGKRWLLPIFVGGIAVPVLIAAVFLTRGYLGRSGGEEVFDRRDGGREKIEGQEVVADSHPDKTLDDTLENARSATGSAEVGEDRSVAEVSRYVTIVFLDIPKGGKAYLDGNLASQKGERVALSEVALAYRIEVPGYDVLTGQVVPDRDHKISVLKDLRKTRSARLWEGEKKRSKRKIIKTGEKRVRKAKDSLIKGPRDTVLDTDYDG